VFVAVHDADLRRYGERPRQAEAVSDPHLLRAILKRSDGDRREEFARSVPTDPLGQVIPCRPTAGERVAHRSRHFLRGGHRPSAPGGTEDERP
jgi:hypothetical protein